MSKKIYLTETQFKDILLEELSIADEVIRVSKEILNILLIKSEKNKEFNFKISCGLEIEMKIFSFKNNKEFSFWLENGGVKYLYNGFSLENNKINLSGVEINGILDVSTIENNVFHEVEHYFQTLKRGKTLYTSGYNKIIDGMTNFNPIISTVCEILYHTKKYELDAVVNGFYSDIKNYDVGKDDFYTLLEKTEVSLLLEKFNLWENNISKWNQTPLFNSARKYLYETGIIKDISFIKIKKMLLSKITKSKKYLLTKISKVYALCKKRHDNNIVELKPKNIMEAMMYSRFGQNFNSIINDNDACLNIKKIF